MELMVDVSRFGLFLGAALVLLLVPGPAVLYIVARSIDQGRLAGAVSALGVGLGNLVHALAAVLGLSAILASSAIAFSAVKFLGAAYLVYLGVRRLLSHYQQASVPTEQRRLHRVFARRACRRAQPEDRPVLSGVLAAVRRRLTRGGVGTGSGARSGLRGSGSLHRQRLRAGERDGGAAGCSNAQASCAVSVTSAAAST